MNWWSGNLWQKFKWRIAAGLKSFSFMNSVILMLLMQLLREMTSLMDEKLFIKIIWLWGDAREFIGMGRASEGLLNMKQ